MCRSKWKDFELIDPYTMEMNWPKILFTEKKKNLGQRRRAESSGVASKRIVAFTDRASQALEMKARRLILASEAAIPPMLVMYKKSV